MRLYGALQELTSLVIRLASGKTVKIQGAEQTAAGETQITIPDVVDGADTVVLVDTQQTLTNKTLTAPTMTNAAINSTTNLKLPVVNNPQALPKGVAAWSENGNLLIIGGSDTPTGATDKIIVDEKSTQTLENKTISGVLSTSLVVSGGTIKGSILGGSGPNEKVSIDYASKINLSSLTTGVGNTHVLITDANGDIDSEATLSKARGGAGADMTNVVFPATGTLVTEDGSQTLSNKTIGTVTAASGTMTISGTGALRLPLGTEANRPAGTAATLKGMIRYNDEADAFEGYNELSGWSSLGGGGTTDRVTQASHGFVVGEVLYLNGSTYAKALATAANTAEVVGVVSRVIDASTFELTLSGEISGLSGLTPGEVYFLSAATAGALTVTEPSVVGQVSLPVGVASSATTLYVAPKRGVVVGAANARTTISVANNAATNVVSVTDYNSLKLEGELNVTRSSGGNQRAYYTVEAAKNGAGVWQVSASYTGDDVLYTTLPSWDVASNNLQVTMPLVTNFSSASLTYALNTPAVGASLPLSVDSSSLNIVSEAPLSYRNRVINGNFDIWQRGTSQTSAGYGSDDRWNNFHSGSTKTHSQQTFALGQTDVPGNPKYFSRTVVSSVAGASNNVVKIHKVEDVSTFAGETATLSFWAKADAAKNIALEFVQEFGTGGSPSAAVIGIGVTTCALTTSWKKFTITVAIPSISGKTLGTTNDNSLAFIFWFDAGSSFNSRTNSLGQQSGTFDISGVQLEVGSKASAFERRPYGMELALCQRYYQIIDMGTNNVISSSYQSGTSCESTYIPFVVPMRDGASITLANTISGAQVQTWAGTLIGTVTSVSIIGNSKGNSGFRISANGTSLGGQAASFIYLASNDIAINNEL